MPAPVLSLRGLVKRRRSADRQFTIGVEALDLAPGELVALTGPSGSGKSTLLEILGLASRPDEIAEFRFSGADGDARKAFEAGDRAALARMRGRRIGFLLQTGGLAPFLTVGEHLALAQRIAGRENAALCKELAQRLDVADLLNARPGALSIGQRQRAALARALAHKPDLVLADEPTAALDPENKAKTAKLLIEAAELSGAAVIVATHESGIFGNGPVRRLTIRTMAEQGGAIAWPEEAA